MFRLTYYLFRQDFELLCLDGTRAPVSAYAECSLGKAPSHAVVTSVNASSEVANTIREFLQVAQVDHFERM